MKREKAMRIAMSLLLFLVAAFAEAQGNKISFTVTKEPLSSALNQVERQSGYFKINYDYSQLSQYKVTAVLKNATALEAVRTLIKKLPFYAQQDGRYIQVRKNQTGDQRQPAKPQGVGGVSGRIVDSDGEPLIGARVTVVGTKKGTITDSDGNFHIADASPNDVITVSYIGKKTLRRKAGTQNMNIVVDDDRRTIDDVVVVGYGAMKKKDLTGSVTTVDAKELVNMPAVTLDDALAGKVAGMQVTKADGSPGGAVRIRVRGGSSIQGGVDPLYIIDGIPTEINNNYISSDEIVSPMEASNYGDDFGTSISGSFARGLNSLVGLNMEDIESISVLKDASATAIYGSKAANGVVIITTKRGARDQKPQINVSYALGISNPIKEKLLNGDQYIQCLKESIANSDANLAANGISKDNSRILADLLSVGNANTDWLDLVLRTAVSHTVNASLSGGSQKSRYYASLSYNTQDGTLIGTDFNRYTGKLSLDSEVTKCFRAGINTSFSYSKTNITDGVYGQALMAPPVLPAYNADRSYADYSKIDDLASSYMGFQNPVALASATNEAKTYGFKGSVFGEYKIMEDLRFKSTLSLSYTNYNQRNYIPSYISVSGFYGSEDSEGGKGSQSQSIATSLYWENNLTLNHDFNDIHHVDAVIGSAWETDQSEYFSASGKGYPDDKYLNGLSSAMYATKVAGANPSAQTALLSFYLRANYSLYDKYLFTFTGRSDASSKFSKAHRTGYFPSGAIAWRLSKEPFLRNAKWIDDLKIRASLGKTGTQKISNWMFLTLYSPNSYAGANAIYPSQLGNDDIRWESTVEHDLALDFAFFNNRLSGTLNYYHKVTDGALLNITPAPSTGYSTVVSNVAKVRNTGVELELMGDIIRNRDWGWTAALNISHNASKVLNIYGDMFSSSTDRKEVNLGTSVIKEGESLGMLCGYKAVGIIKTQEQLDDYKSRFSSWAYMMPDLGIGSIELAIDPESGYYYQDVIGNCTPDFYGGLTTNLRYKNWSLMAGFTFSYGNDLIYQKDVNDMGFNNNSTYANRGTSILNASTPSRLTDRPANVFRNWYTLTNLNVYDASYLKLQTLSLSYSLPRKLMKQLKLTNAQVYATASNLFTITRYPGADPAVSDDPYSISGGGRDISSYPTVKSFTFGVRLGF